MAEKFLVNGPRVSLHQLDNIFILTMKDGENKFTPMLIQEIRSCLDLVERTQGAAALITTGHGRFYSNGIDLKWISDNPSETNNFIQSLQQLLARFLTFPMPTIAAINGHCYAGAVLMALVHDYRIMREDKGWMCIPAADIGLRLPLAFIEIVKAKLSNGSLVRDIVLGARRFGGKEAEGVGLIDQACDLSHVLENSIQLAKKMAHKGSDRMTFGSLKREMYYGVHSMLAGDNHFDGFHSIRPRPRL